MKHLFCFLLKQIEYGQRILLEMLVSDPEEHTGR